MIYKVIKSIPQRVLLLLAFFGMFFTGISFAGQQKIYIETLGPCFEASKIDGDKVFLNSIKTPCGNKVNIVSVNVDDSFKSVLVYIDGNFFKKQAVQNININMDSVRNSLEKSDKESQNMKLPDNQHGKYGSAEAEKAFNKYQSKEFQDKIAQEVDRLKNALMGNQQAKTPEAGDNRKGPGLNVNERIYIFISSSVPAQTLRSYVQDVDKVHNPNISLVMRGFIGGMKYMKPTQKFIAELSKKNPQCDHTREHCEMYFANAMVDPLLFRKYNISRVPSVVYVPDIIVKDTSQSEGRPENASIQNYYLVTGDASLEYSLDMIYKETNRDSLKQTLKKLRKGFY